MGVFNEWVTSGTDEKICGVVTGLVKDNYDQEHPGMVKVEYFLGENGKNVTGWVPVAAPYAFKDSGLYLLPEVGAVVVIAFNMGDRNCPIVIGSLWNKKNDLPKETAKDKNTIKRFKTKGGNEVIFEEEQGKEAIELHTPKSQTIRIDDEKETITIFDKEKKNGIKMEMKDGNITIIAEKKMTFEVGSQKMITMDGKTVQIKGDDIKAEATKGLNLKGQNLKAEGTQTDIEGKSSLNVKSSGMTQVKGTTVKIN